MNKYLAIIGLILLGVAAVIWALTTRVAVAPLDVLACSQEAKICPDGSSVGRSGPNCEFEACPYVAPAPTPVPTSTSSTSTPIAVGGNTVVQGTTIRVLELIEDSRCPVDVQCIQAGTVRVRAAIDSSNKDFTFTLLQPQIVGTTTITLVSVVPQQKYAKQTVPQGDYRFIFTVVPKVVGSGVRGTVLLSPNCPVESNLPDPACAQKPYATALSVYRSGGSVPLLLGNSNAQGSFEFALAPGTYTLEAVGGQTFPRCAKSKITVVANQYATTSIACDTGIR